MGGPSSGTNTCRRPGRWRGGCGGRPPSAPSGRTPASTRGDPRRALGLLGAAGLERPLQRGLGRPLRGEQGRPLQRELEQPLQREQGQPLQRELGEEQEQPLQREQQQEVQQGFAELP